MEPYRAVLGDANNNPYAGGGMYWVRPYDSANENNVSTMGAPYRVRAGVALIVPRGGRVVWIGPGLDKKLTVLGYDHDDLVAAGINPTSTQPNDPYREWIRLKQIQNFRALPLATGNTPSLKIQVRQLFYLTATGDMVRWNGTNADTHIDVTDYVPALGFQCYIVLWLRTYNPNGLPPIQVTYSDHIDSVDGVLSFDELQQCADAADADAIPIQAFRLADAQTTLKLDDTTDVDLRQFINMPQVYGFPNTVSRAYRIHEGFSVVAPSEVSIAAGGLITIQDNALLYILSDVAFEEGGGSGGGGIAGVDLTMPDEFVVTGSGTDVLGVDWAETVPVSYFFASGSGPGPMNTKPVFRPMTITDLPTITREKLGDTVFYTDVADPTSSDGVDMNFGSVWRNTAPNPDRLWIMTKPLPGSIFQLIGKINTVVDSVSWLNTTTNSTGDVTIAAATGLAAAQVLATDPTTTSVVALRSLAAEHLPTVPINKGGTNATTAVAGFNNLSPLTTEGDLLTRDGTNNIRLAAPGALQSIRRNAGNTAWEAYTPTGPVTVNVYRYVTPGNHTYTKSANAFHIEVYVIAAGSGGGSGRKGALNTLRFGGAGGAPGNVVKDSFPASMIASSVDVVVGAGGIGGTAISTSDTNGNPGATGGSSLFGGLTEALAILAAINTANGGGRGGTATTSTPGVGNLVWGPTVQYPGANGGESNSTLATAQGKSAGYGPASGGAGAFLSGANALGGNGDGGVGNGARWRTPVNGGGGTSSGGPGGDGADGVDVSVTPSTDIFADGGGGGRHRRRYPASRVVMAARQVVAALAAAGP
jgi:hypothetical protein